MSAPLSTWSEHKSLAADGCAVKYYQRRRTSPCAGLPWVFSQPQLPHAQRSSYALYDQTGPRSLVYDVFCTGHSPQHKVLWGAGAQVIKSDSRQVLVRCFTFAFENVFVCQHGSLKLCCRSKVNPGVISHSLSLHEVQYSNHTSLWPWPGKTPEMLGRVFSPCLWRVRLCNHWFDFDYGSNVMTQPRLLWPLESTHQQFKVTGQWPGRTWSEVTNQGSVRCGLVWSRVSIEGLFELLHTTYLLCKGLGVYYLLTHRPMALQLCSALWLPPRDVLVIFFRYALTCIFPLHSLYFGLDHEKQPLYTGAARKRSGQH